MEPLPVDSIITFKLYFKHSNSKELIKAGSFANEYFFIKYDIKQLDVIV